MQGSCGTSLVFLFPHISFDVDINGCVDLQLIAHKYGDTENGSGLASLTHTLLNANLMKIRSVTFLAYIEIEK